MQPAAVVMPSTGFNEEDPKYKCCCQRCHIKQGAMIIGIVEAIGIGADLVASLLGGHFGQNIGPIVVFAAVLGCLFYGLKEERTGFLIPHLVVQVIGIVMLVIFCITAGIAITLGGGFLIAMFDLQQQKHGGEQIFSGVVIGVGIAIIIFIMIAVALEIWWFTVILGCYRYLNDKKNMAQVAMTLAQPSGYPQPAAGASASDRYEQQQEPPPSYHFKQ